MPIRGSDGGYCSRSFRPMARPLDSRVDRADQMGAARRRRRGDDRRTDWRSAAAQPRGCPTAPSCLRVDNRGLQSVPVSGGSVRQLTVDRSGKAASSSTVWPIPVPGGRAVSFTVHYGARDTQRVHAVSLDSGARTMLVEGNGARFLPSGHIVFQRLGSMWAARFDPARLALTSPPAAVIDNVGICGRLESDRRRRRKAVRWPTPPEDNPTCHARLVWVDRAGGEQPDRCVPTRSWFWPQVSPDGKRIGFHDMNPVNMDVWIYDLERAALVRMTFDPRQDGYPLWSPDGKQIAFWSRQHGDAGNLYVRSADLTGAGSAPDDQPELPVAVLLGRRRNVARLPAEFMRDGIRTSASSPSTARRRRPCS